MLLPASLPISGQHATQLNARPSAASRHTRPADLTGLRRGALISIRGMHNLIFKLFRDGSIY